MITRFYDDREEHERKKLDAHLSNCHVLAVPTTAGQEKLYEYALDPLLKEGKIRGYIITRDSIEAFDGLFNPKIDGELVTVVHQTSELVNKREAARRKALLTISDATEGIHPILVDPDAHEYIDVKTDKHYAIRKGIPSFPPTSETMSPCEEHMLKLLSLSHHHLFDHPEVAG